MDHGSECCNYLLTVDVENNTVENLEKLFKAFKAHDLPVAVSDARGLALVTTLTPYQYNLLAVRPEEVPLEYRITRHEVTAIEEGGIEVEYNGAKSFIRRSDLSRDRGDQRPERFNVGDKIDVRVTNIDPKTRRLGLSIKAREIAEEKEAVEQYGSSDSGASLGDILGAALKGGNK